MPKTHVITKRERLLGWCLVFGIVVWYVTYALGVLPKVYPLGVNISGLIVGLVVLVWYRWSLAPHPVSNELPDTEAIDDAAAHELIDRMRRGGRHEDRIQLKRLIRLLVTPQQLGRATEYIDFTADTFHREISSAWILPGSFADGRMIWFPVMTPAKGTLVDRLRVTTADGEELPMVPIRRVHEICVAAWSYLVDQLCESAQSRVPEELRNRIYEYGAQQILCRLDRNDREIVNRMQMKSDDAVAGLRALLDEAGIPRDNARNKVATIAEPFLHTLTTRFVVLAALAPSSKHLLLLHSYRFAFTRHAVPGSTKRGRWRRFWLSLKDSTGRGSPEILLDVSLAQPAASYHLEILVPRQNYVAIAMLQDARKNLLPQQVRSTYGVERWYFRIARPGRRFLHFYSRGLENLPAAKVLLVRVSEHAWASLLKAVMFSGVATGCMGLNASAVVFSGDDAATVAFGLVGIPFTLGVTWLSLWPTNPKVANAFASFMLTAASLLLLGMNGLGCADVINGWDQWWSGQVLLETSFRLSFGCFVFGVCTFAIRMAIWSRTYPRRPPAEIAA